MFSIFKMWDMIKNTFGSIGKWITNFTDGVDTVKNAFGNAGKLAHEFMSFLPSEIWVMLTLGITLLLAIAVVNIVIDLL